MSSPMLSGIAKAGEDQRHDPLRYLSLCLQRPRSRPVNSALWRPFRLVGLGLEFRMRVREGEG